VVKGSSDGLLFNLSPSVSCYKGLVMHDTVGYEQKSVLSDDYYISSDVLSKSYILPGSWRKSVNCVGLLPVGFCPCCGKVKLVSGNCGSPACPSCATQWRYARTKSIFHRLFSYKITKKTRLIHAVVSLPESEIDKLRSKSDVDDLRGVVYRYCENKAFDGGVIVFHPWRLIDDCKEELRYIAQGLDEWSPGEFGLWKTLIKLENWRDFVYFSPHFHILGAASWIVPAFAGEGWVFKRIRDLILPEDIVRCSMYLLSHVGIPLYFNSKSVFWFGALSNASWSLDKAPEPVQQFTVDACSKSMSNFSVEGDDSYLVCPNCCEEYVNMAVAPKFFSRFNGIVNERLRLCYLWSSGAIPPPSDGVMKRLELI